jgi:hypothetical protein
MSNSISCVSAILSDARYVAEVYAKQKEVQQPIVTPQKALQSIQLMNKIHNDQLAKDPTWINGVHCHDSASRHNYTYAIKVQSPIAVQ